MTQNVEVPGVGTLQFPDSMSQPEMAAAIQKNFPQVGKPKTSTSESKPAPSSLKDRAREMASGAGRMLGKGAIGAATFIPDMAVQGANAVGGAIDKAAGIKEADIELPSSFWNRQLDSALPPPASKGARAVQEAGGMLVTGATGLAKSAEKGAEKVVQHVVEQAGLSRVTTKAAEDAYVAGIKLPPKYVGGPIRKALQTMGGGPKVDAEFSKENAPVIDRLAKLAIGLHPNEELTEEALEKLKTEAYKPYEVVRTLGKIPADAQYAADIGNAGGRFASRGGSFGGSRFPEIDAEKAPYLQKEFAAGEALDEIRMLRKLSRDNLKQYNPSANALGYTQRGIANALEARIDRFAQSRQAGGFVKGAAPTEAPLVKQLRAAREQLAKIGVVEDAIGAGGHIVAEDFKRMLDKGVPLSDSLRTIAVTAKNFPDAVKAVTPKGESGVWSAVDYLLGGSGIVSGHPAVAGLSLARPISRWSLRTEGAQKAMINDLRKSPPGAVSKAVTKATGAAAKATGKAAGATTRGAAMQGAEALAESEQEQ